MEVAAAAVAFVSFGIEIARGTIAYLDAIDDRDGALHAVAQRARRLRTQFETINFAIRDQDVEHQLPGDNVRACIADCENHLRPLEEFLIEISDAPPTLTTGLGSRTSRTKEIIDRIKKKGLYPFKRSKILTLEKRLEGANLALDIALTTLNLCAFHYHCFSMFSKLTVGSQFLIVDRPERCFD